jgi:hypothetical protein
MPEVNGEYVDFFTKEERNRIEKVCTEMESYGWTGIGSFDDLRSLVQVLQAILSERELE